MSEEELHAEANSRKWPSHLRFPGLGAAAARVREALELWDGSCYSPASPIPLLVDPTAGEEDSGSESDCSESEEEEEERQQKEGGGYGEEDQSDDGGEAMVEDDEKDQEEEEEEVAEDDELHQFFLKPLDAQAQAAVDEARDQPRGDNNTNVIFELPAAASGTRVSILGHHLHRMNDGQWLKDEVINSYMWLLQMRDNERVHRHDNSRTGDSVAKKPSHFFNSFFFEKLGNGEATANYEAVRRHAKKQVKSTVPPGNIFGLDKLVIPININDSHWTLIVAFMQERRVQYYDSLHSPGANYLKAFKVYLQGEAEKWKGDKLVPEHLLNIDEWNLVPTDHTATPKQNNNPDCGAFACTIANYISNGLSLRFSCDNMPYFRQRITHDLLHAIDEIREFETAEALIGRMGWLLRVMRLLGRRSRGAAGHARNQAAVPNSGRKEQGRTRSFIAATVAARSTRRSSPWAASGERQPQPQRVPSPRPRRGWRRRTRSRGGRGGRARLAGAKFGKKARGQRRYTGALTATARAGGIRRSRRSKI